MAVGTSSASSSSGNLSRIQSTVRIKRQKEPVSIGTRLYRMWGWFLVAVMTVTFTYAFCVVFAFKVIKKRDEKTFQILVGIYGYLFFFFEWAFWLTATTPPPEIPDLFRFTDAELRQVEAVDKKAREQSASDAENKDDKDKVKKIFALELEPMALKRRIRTRTKDKAVNYCLTCYCFKPERSHHCRVCDTCVARMDHHCPLFNNCIHWANQKTFVLSLIYGVLSVTYCCVSSASYLFMNGLMKEVNANDKIALYVMWGFSVLVMVLIWPFSFYHLYLTSKNLTHIENRTGGEHFVGGKEDSFDLGSACENWQQIFGMNYALFCIPIRNTPGDGMYFMSKSEYIAAAPPQQVIGEGAAGMSRLSVVNQDQISRIGAGKAALKSTIGLRKASV